MDFWFDFLDIHMNEKGQTYHDCHGFKWLNINISPILTVFKANLTSFLVHFIVTTPKWHNFWDNSRVLLQVQMIIYDTNCFEKLKGTY
jgi:hypothetical protein